MKTGVPIFADMRHKLITIATQLKRAVAITILCYYKAHYLLDACWKFGKHQSRDSGENNTNVRILPMCTHQPSANSHQHLKELLH